MAVQRVTDATFQDFVQQKGTVLVDFTASWRPPCRRTDPLVDQLAAEMPGVHVGKLDVDESAATAARLGVMSMPTFMVFRDGRKVDQIVGAVPKATLVQAVKG